MQSDRVLFNALNVLVRYSKTMLFISGLFCSKKRNISEYVSCCDLQFGVFSLFVACIFSYFFFNADKDFCFYLEATVTAVQESRYNCTLHAHYQNTLKLELGRFC